MRQQVKRITPTSQQILAAPQHQRTAQRFGLLAGADLVHRQPAWSDDSGIERAPGIVFTEAASESETQVGEVARRMRPAVDADQILGDERIRRLLEHFARHRLEQGFVGLEVAGRLIEAHAVVRLLLDEQETAFAFDDRSNGHMGHPDHEDSEQVDETSRTRGAQGPPPAAKATILQPSDRQNRLEFPFPETPDGGSPVSMADRDGYIWYDGELVPWRDATTHVLTHTLHYGMGVFEGLRAYPTERGPAIFRLREHTARLLNSARIFQMKMPYDEATLIEAQKAVVRANRLEACYIRPIVFYGAEAMGIAASTLSTHVAVAAWPWGAYLGAEGLAKGIRVKTSSFTRHHVNVNMCRAKSVSTYTNSILAHQEVAHDGYDEALLLDVDGYVAEGAGENLFIVKQYTRHELFMNFKDWHLSDCPWKEKMPASSREKYCTREESK